MKALKVSVLVAAALVVGSSSVYAQSAKGEMKKNTSCEWKSPVASKDLPAATNPARPGVKPASARPAVE